MSREERRAEARGSDQGEAALGADVGPYAREPDRGVDRRTFVKGAAVGAALGAAAAGGLGIFRQVAQVDPTIVRTVQYLGAQQSVQSPAPRGLPLVPVRVDDQGFVTGVPSDEEENYLDWYRYCSHETTPGLLEGSTEDNVFRYFLPAEKLEKAEPSPEAVYWYADRLDEEVRADHFRDLPYGSGAAVRWRSEGRAGNDVITALVLKLDPGTLRLSEADLERFMDPEHHLIGYSTFCTHFCCVPGYREDPVARTSGLWDWIYCGCHGSRFDPTDVRTFTFELRVPRDVG